MYSPTPPARGGFPALPVLLGVGGLVFGLIAGCGAGYGMGAADTTATPRPPARAAEVASAPVASTPPAPKKVRVTVTVTKTVKPKRTHSAPAAPPAQPRTDPHFGTCAAANAAGYGPYRQGVDPEYDWYTDRDHDGVVCES
ncbi:excalibur calcium-binding domain-containing protein [Actinomadura atramentaria]|uniref:excalibur calcium-binding domain-containing protein n=1 Tax=Actinomadura atramentaria TaxID=1990 RepID=UPI00037A01D3|nr:excalibur calcium-binding domain-containing protein [Actinomadura atramentaria]